MKTLFYSITNNKQFNKYVNFLLHLATAHRKGDVLARITHNLSHIHSAIRMKFNFR